MNRLETVAPDLVEQLRAADEADRRRAAAAAVELAVERSGVNHITILQAAKAVRPGIDQPATAELRAAAQDLDEAYLKLHERFTQDPGTEQDQEAHFQAFYEARAAAAVVAALDGDPLEAIYEAQAAVPDSASVLDAVRVALADQGG